MSGRRTGWSRRDFLRRSMAAGAVGWTPQLWTPARAAAAHALRGQALRTAGTTLESTIVPSGTSGYRTLIVGPPLPIVVRDELAPAQAGREGRRRGIATVAHLTDIHLVDAQSPARVEFIDRYADAPFDSLPTVGAFRAHETLTTQVAHSMITRINDVGVGPVTGRPIDCAVNTGDNIDNFQHNELRWYLQLLDGGIVVPNSGDPSTYEGVQQSDDTDVHYWHPDPGSIADNYKTLHGFPEVDGLLAASVSGFTTPGLRFPWYSCYGNHDGLLQGNLSTNPALEAVAVGSVKITGSTLSGGDLQSLFETQDAALFAAVLTSSTSIGRTVTGDDDRRAVHPAEWVAAHHESTSSPKGHGYPEDALGSGLLYYTFPVAEGVLGICLDTVNHSGYAEGSIGPTQAAWLEAQLVAAHSRYFDAAGVEVRHDVTDHLVVLFSHHNLPTLNNSFPDPVRGDPEPVLADEIEALLHRFPNVVLWVNGHSHVNRILVYPDPSGRTGGFWEVSTAAHIDYPQHARLVEIADNADGTLSIFGTVIEHAAAASTTGAVSDPLVLAAWSRELSFNEIQGDSALGLGSATDLNVELLVPRPFTFPATGATTTTTTTAPGSGGSLPPTGGGTTALVAGGALAAAAVALRSRTTTTTTTTAATTATPTATATATATATPPSPR